MKEEKLVKIGEWLNTLGYDLNLEDDFWMEDFITDHKFRDLADLLDKYHTFKLNMHIVSSTFKDKETPNFGDWISQYKRTTDGYYHINKNLAFKYNKMVKLYNKEFNIEP